jgi:pyridoxamine 5'-phosphate oxidase
MPPLRREDLSADPIEQFGVWYEVARREVPLADAMALATVDAEGVPDARMVLLKGVGAEGFRFFTNLESAKGRQLDAAPHAALVIYWRELDRQVRVRGQVEVLPRAASDEYFATRPRDSQIGAWASPQSRALAGRDELDRRAVESERRFADSEIARPPFWGGFLVRPSRVEFWQGQVARLHDRFCYSRTDTGWQIERLAP